MMRWDNIRPVYVDPEVEPEVARWEAERAEEERAEREREAAWLAEGRALAAERYAREAEERKAAEAAEAAIQAEQQRRHEEAAERRQAQARHELPFMATSVARIVATTIERSIHYGWNSLIIGEAGVGKTYALREAVRRWAAGEGPEVALLNITSAIGSSTREVLREVGPLLGVEPIDDIAGMERRIAKQISRYPVVLLDEAQNLGLKQIRTLLNISDATGIQLVFCGNGEVLKLVASKQAAMASHAVSRRIPLREEIVCIVEDDVKLIASHFGVDGPEAWAACFAVGARYHADGVAKVLSAARSRLKADGPVTAAAIRQALALMPHFASALDAEPPRKRAQRRTTLGPA